MKLTGQIPLVRSHRNCTVEGWQNDSVIRWRKNLVKFDFARTLFRMVMDVDLGLSTCDSSYTTSDTPADSDDDDSLEENPSRRRVTLLSFAEDSILDHILAFLDARSLVRFDGCCRESSQRSIRTWSELAKDHISTVSFARAELDAMLTMELDGGGAKKDGSGGSVQSTTTTNVPKTHVIMYERLRSFAHKMEYLELEEGENYQQQDLNMILTDTQTPSRSTTARRRRCQPTGNSPSLLSQYFDPQAFREPEAFIFYVKMMTSHTKELSTTTTTSKSRDENKHTANSTANIVHWEGLVSALDQGGWGSSSILFFHLREVATVLHWTPEMEHVLRYVHNREVHHPIDDEEYQHLVKKAFQNFSLVMVAFPKHEQPHCIASRPRLVVATKGLSFVSQDNRLYFHLPSRHYDTCQLKKDDKEHVPSSSSWVYPRLVTSEAVDQDKPGELFGIRLVCNQSGGELLFSTLA